MKLVLLNGPLAGQEYPLALNTVSIGRDRMNDIRLSLDAGVGLFHCHVVKEEGRYWIEDLGSAAGTQVEGKGEVRRQPLEPGDVVRVGDTYFALLERGADIRPLVAEWARRLAPGATGAAPPEPPPEPARPLSRGRVLLVDDQDDVRIVYSTILAGKGYQVVTAADGEEALAVAQADPPDAIVLDVMMPKLDGWAVARRLRAMPRFALVPILFLTALSEARDRMRGFRLGADDYVPKLDSGDLDLRLEAALVRRDRLAAMLAGAGPQPHAPGVRGDLDQLGLPTLLSSLEMERKTGTLHLTGAHGASGDLLIREGEVIAARVTGNARLRNAEAVFFFLAWSGGGFEFLPGPVDGEDEVRTSVANLLLEAARRQDEAGRGQP